MKRMTQTSYLSPEEAVEELESAFSHNRSPWLREKAQVGDNWNLNLEYDFFDIPESESPPYAPAHRIYVEVHIQPFKNLTRVNWVKQLSRQAMARVPDDSNCRKSPLQMLRFTDDLISNTVAMPPKRLLVLIEDRVKSYFDAYNAFTNLGFRHGQEPFFGDWRDKIWLNTPGPIYSTEPALTGELPEKSRDNIARESRGYAVVYRQPEDEEELKVLLDAFETGGMTGFGLNGNLLWTPEAVDKWWGRRARILNEADHSEEWLEYAISGGLEDYLEMYKQYLREFNCELNYLANVSLQR